MDRNVARSKLIREHAVALADLLKLEGDEDTLELRVALGHISSGKRAASWRFALLQAHLNRLVVHHLTENSIRPIKAVRLWSNLLEGVEPHSCEVRFSRKELAARVGCPPCTISTLISELEAIGAVYRKPDRPGRYYVNPRICTRLGPAERVAAQAGVLPLKLSPVAEVRGAA